MLKLIIIYLLDSYKLISILSIFEVKLIEMLKFNEFHFYIVAPFK